MFDFGLGATELMLIAVVALIVVGPKDLPRLMRWVGNAVARVRAMAREFQGHLDEAMRETGLDEVKDSVTKVKEYTVADLDAEFEKLEREFRETALPDSPDDGAKGRRNGKNGAAGDDDVTDLDEDLLDETERPILSLDEDVPARKSGGTDAGKGRSGDVKVDEANRRSARQAGEEVAEADGRSAAGQEGREGDAGSNRTEGTDTGGKAT